MAVLSTRTPQSPMVYSVEPSLTAAPEAADVVVRDEARLHELFGDFLDAFCCQAADELALSLHLQGGVQRECALSLVSGRGKLKFVTSAPQGSRQKARAWRFADDLGEALPEASAQKAVFDFFAASASTGVVSVTLKTKFKLTVHGAPHMLGRFDGAAQDPAPRLCDVDVPAETFSAEFRTVDASEAGRR